MQKAECARPTRLALYARTASQPDMPCRSRSEQRRRPWQAIQADAVERQQTKNTDRQTDRHTHTLGYLRPAGFSTLTATFRRTRVSFNFSGVQLYQHTISAGCTCAPVNRWNLLTCFSHGNYKGYLFQAARSRKKKKKQGWPRGGRRNCRERTHAPKRALSESNSAVTRRNSSAACSARDSAAAARASSCSAVPLPLSARAAASCAARRAAAARAAASSWSHCACLLRTSPALAFMVKRFKCFFTPHAGREGRRTDNQTTGTAPERHGTAHRNTENACGVRTVFKIARACHQDLCPSQGWWRI